MIPRRCKRHKRTERYAKRLQKLVQFRNEKASSLEKQSQLTVSPRYRRIQLLTVFHPTKTKIDKKGRETERERELENE